MTLNGSQKKGLIATVFFHTGIILLLLYFGITMTLPTVDTEGGITLDFGNSETGIGLEEPPAGRIQVDKEDKPYAEPAAPKIKIKAAASKEEDRLTQDHDNSA
jgi:hypothetical protein